MILHPLNVGDTLQSIMGMEAKVTKVTPTGVEILTNDKQIKELSYKYLEKGPWDVKTTNK